VHTLDSLQEKNLKRQYICTCGYIWAGSVIGSRTSSVQLLDQSAEAGVPASRWRSHLAQGAVAYPSEVTRLVWHKQDPCASALASQQVTHWGMYSNVLNWVRNRHWEIDRKPKWKCASLEGLEVQWTSTSAFSCRCTNILKWSVDWLRWATHGASLVPWPNADKTCWSHLYQDMWMT
jgi:hypothetical protein